MDMDQDRAFQKIVALIKKKIKAEGLILKSFEVVEPTRDDLSRDGAKRVAPGEDCYVQFHFKRPIDVRRFKLKSQP